MAHAWVVLNIDGGGTEKGTGYFSGDSYKISQFRFLVQIASESCSDFLQFEIVGLLQWTEVCVLTKLQLT